MKALYIICANSSIDLVGYNVFEYLKENYQIEKLDYNTDLCEMYITKDDDHEYYLMITDDHVMHNTEKYLDFLNNNFSDVEAAIHVNYHEGTTAPDPILSVHHVGDILSGTYLPYNPKYATNLLVNMERLRKDNGLDTFTCESETTHFSGVVTNIDPKLLLEYPVNNIDLEIGSLAESFNNKIAIKTITETMFEVFNDTNDNRLNVLYLGGAHFEATYTNAILDSKYPIYLSHQLCGLWLMQTDYENTAYDTLKDLIEKSTIKYDAIVFHEKVKKLKPILNKLGEDLDIKVFKYNALKNIENSELKKLF
ncbi:D-tyrosyl-tRNA(Tyr) deacylase [Bacilli bacterium PM5-3]|nr:D-tyrosyl-tRNA(Tyr) deacylase [Bacilli bacterium PM5-3]MDH6603998.1 D-tyrosyl-tRNA(Tyr) deacylase [Bacilli bacterium PM5-9]